ncbi:MAG: hypothetical protein EP343_19235 [Deltaproteobacteria bacterium]|nr:MAG: hypothetical protein EP343_19235 [Deltaproteobacteria bacterium]
MKKSDVFVLSLVGWFVLAGLGVAGASNDAQKQVVETYFSCMKKYGTCKVSKFATHDALRLFKTHKLFFSKFRLVNRGYVEEVANVVKDSHLKMLAKAEKSLKKAGYDTLELSKLGNGQAIINLGPRVAVAMFWATHQALKGGPARTNYGCMVMWKSKSDAPWKIAFTPQYRNLEAALLANLPEWMQPKKKAKAEKPSSDKKKAVPPPRSR